MCRPAPAIDIHLYPPSTREALLRNSVVPSPSWLSLFMPQQYASPSDVNPHVCQYPALSDSHTEILTDVAALTSPAEAVMIAVPPRTDCTDPVVDTVAMLSSELDHVIVASSM